MILWSQKEITPFTPHVIPNIYFCIAVLLADGNAFTHTHHHVTHNTFVGLAIKVNDFVAEFFEFSIGKAL